MSTTAQFPRTGDLVLMSGRFDIIAAQAVLRRRRAHYVHVAVAVDDEVFVDSGKKRGVGVGYWTELASRKRISVLRHRPTEATSHGRLDAMLEHYGKAYNMAFHWKRLPILRKYFQDAFYCTEFVGQIFTKEELGIPENQELIVPYDLEALVSAPDWIDVTAIYRPYIEGTKSSTSVTSGSGLANLFKTQGQVNQLIRAHSAMMAEVDAWLEELTTMLRGHSKKWMKLASSVKTAQDRRRKARRFRR